MTTGEALARQIEAELHDLESLEQESRLPVPPPEHDDYRNFNQREGA